MKQGIRKQSDKKAAFTIIELLTVMSVIIILIGLLVPALNRVKRVAKEVKQRAQFHSIDVAMELFETVQDEYPDSDEKDSAGNSYCGAMKLAEAMVGQDLLGFHPDSLFRSDLQDDDNNWLYGDSGNYEPTKANLKARRGPYLQLENANAIRIGSVYGGSAVGSFDKDRFVLCDVYDRTMPNAGEKTGMPILYYKANTSGSKNPNRDNTVTKDDNDNIYNYKDNDELVQLGIPWMPAEKHPMDSTEGEGTGDDDGIGTEETFYHRINNDDIEIDLGRPYKSDSYILLSAGFDGEYGTRDDILNFQN